MSSWQLGPISLEAARFLIEVLACSSLPGRIAASALYGLILYPAKTAVADDPLTRVYDAVGNVIETPEHKGDFKEPKITLF